MRRNKSEEQLHHAGRGWLALARVRVMRIPTPKSNTAQLVVVKDLEVTVGLIARHKGTAITQAQQLGVCGAVSVIIISTLNIVVIVI